MSDERTARQRRLDRITIDLLSKSADALDARQRAIIERAIDRHAGDRHAGHAPVEPGLGERLADRVAEFGGSWSFIIGFAAILSLWALLNTAVLVAPFDPYPYIFLNLVLSTLAAVQAPIIMMSQNRMAAHDRVQARRDFEINLKAELEILALHEKLDRLLASQSGGDAGMDPAPPPGGPASPSPPSA